MRKLFLIIIVMTIAKNISSQIWEQTKSTPQGSGVTDMLVKQSTGFIYVTTGSAPSEPGGVRVSTDGGDTWLNQTTSYIARTITEGEDGNLYASIWPDTNFFSSEGLYRSTNNGAVWTPLGFVQPGDNIFSIAVQDSPHTIFAGTRNGIIRSKNNGKTFEKSNSGIPDSAWIYDIAIDDSGIVAIASSKGVFISDNNADSWLPVSGIPLEDTAKVLLFINDTAASSSISKINQNNNRLYVGTNYTNIYESFRAAKYLKFTLLYIFGGNELGNFARYKLETFVSVLSFADAGKNSGVYKTKDGKSWELINTGFPPNPRISSLGLKINNKFSLKTQNESSLKINDEPSIELYTGFFENKAGGAKIYHTNIIVGINDISSQIPQSYQLDQNYPNPFNPATTIQYAVPFRSEITIKIFNMLGEEVVQLLNDIKDPGIYNLNWNAAGFPSGIYIYTIQSNSPYNKMNYFNAKKMVLIK